MRASEIEDAANRLWHAALSGQAVAPLRERYPGMGAEEACAIQAFNTTG
ncbi:MAG TPA: hypothetical protein PKD73_00670 [Burkholderiaceae bacterium]|nr:hypothetical protein [Burkholderiaceae bacterium]